MNPNMINHQHTALNNSNIGWLSNIITAEKCNMYRKTASSRLSSSRLLCSSSKLPVTRRCIVEKTVHWMSSRLRTWRGPCSEPPVHPHRNSPPCEKYPGWCRSWCSIRCGCHPRIPRRGTGAQSGRSKKSAATVRKESDRVITPCVTASQTPRARSSNNKAVTPTAHHFHTTIDVRTAHNLRCHLIDQNLQKTEVDYHDNVMIVIYISTSWGFPHVLCINTPCFAILL